MEGIDLNKPIKYRCSSLRFFDQNEHHVTRFCRDDVLLLVYDGILRFSEDGIQYEVHPGEYHIQKKNTFQSGNLASDSQKYFYVHFWADWTSDNKFLPRRGKFEYLAVKSIIEALDQSAYNNFTLVEQTAKFFEILVILYRQNTEITIADQIAEYISQRYFNKLSLEMLTKGKR